MTQIDHISPRLLVRDLVRRYPAAAEILSANGVDPAYDYLSIELAARASNRDPRPVLASLRSDLLAA